MMTKLLLYLSVVISQLNFGRCSLSAGINAFANKLETHIENKNPGDNFVVSPYSLHSVFSQLMHGSIEDTRTELRTALQISPVSRSDLLQQYRTLASSVPSLKTANLLAVKKGFKPKTEYVDNVKRTFGSDVKEFDFSNPRKVAQEINNFVATNTNNKIKDLVDEDMIDAFDTKLLIVNAVYFKAMWKYKFNPKETYVGNFQTVDNRNVNTKFMTLKTKARRSETNDLEVLELPYEDGKTSMIFFLPKSGKSTRHIMNFVKKFSINSLEESFEAGSVTIPKFKLEYEVEDLKGEMRKHGVTSLFSQNRAQLTDISNSKLFVSEASHKAFIEVDEKGTEAAAATAVATNTRSFRPGGGWSFKADRPFVFMIYDKVDRIPLFTGKVADPSKS